MLKFKITGSKIPLLFPNDDKVEYYGASQAFVRCHDKFNHWIFGELGWILVCTLSKEEYEKAKRLLTS